MSLNSGMRITHLQPISIGTSHVSSAHTGQQRCQRTGKSCPSCFLWAPCRGKTDHWGPPWWVFCVWTPSKATACEDVLTLSLLLASCGSPQACPGHPHPRPQEDRLSPLSSWTCARKAATEVGGTRPAGSDTDAPGLGFWHNPSSGDGNAVTWISFELLIS